MAKQTNLPTPRLAGERHLKLRLHGHWTKGALPGGTGCTSGGGCNARRQLGRHNDAGGGGGSHRAQASSLRRWQQSVALLLLLLLLLLLRHTRVHHRLRWRCDVQTTGERNEQAMCYCNTAAIASQGSSEKPSGIVCCHLTWEDLTQADASWLC